MSNISLTEKELKILLVATLKNSGIEVEDIRFSQKVQLFGPNKGIEVFAEIVKKPTADDLSMLLNKLTYQDQNKFTPIENIQAPAYVVPQPQQPQYAQPQQQSQWVQPEQPQYTQQQAPVQNYSFHSAFEEQS